MGVETFDPDSSHAPEQAAEALPASSEAEHYPGPELSFWQEPWVQNGLPLFTSIAVHVALIVLGFLTVKTYTYTRQVSQEQVIVPDATIVAGDVGGVPNPGLGGDPSRPAASDLVPENTRSDGWNKLPSKSLQAAVMGGAGETPNDTLIGIGAGNSLGSGKGGGSGVGGADGSSAPFGVPGGGKGQFKAPFMGSSGNAKTVAYVCDASGSMLGLPFELLKQELRKAVDGLVPSQAFNIVFFREAAAAMYSRESLVVANPSNKKKAYDWLNEQRERANSNPLPSLREIFKQKPQLIYLLTDGAFDDNDAVVGEIRRLNTAKQTRINTIAFFRPDAFPSDRQVCEDVLRQIAKENGGLFKVVLTTDLTNK